MMEPLGEGGNRAASHRVPCRPARGHHGVWTLSTPAPPGSTATPEGSGMSQQPDRHELMSCQIV